MADSHAAGGDVISSRRLAEPAVPLGRSPRAHGGRSRTRRTTASRGGFAGEIADYYASFCRGFGSAALRSLWIRLKARPDELVVDLGCGTGQLAVPLGSRSGCGEATGCVSRDELAAGLGCRRPGLAGLLGQSAVDLSSAGGRTVRRVAAQTCRTGRPEPTRK
jgi:SAM-dependent methyltransferase